MTESGGPPVLAAGELASRLGAAGGLLLALDFDGTLTAVVDDPDAPEITDSNRRALRRLAGAPGVRVAVVSGRALADLRERVGVEGVTYAGNHGLELYRDGEEVVQPAAVECQSVLGELVGVLRDRLADVEGCIVEDKGVTASVHYRQVAADRKGEVQSTVRSVVAEQGSVRVRSGKQVLELRPAVDHDKGTVVRRLVDAVDSGWLSMYVGDDTTDEDAFEVLSAVEGGLGVHVGADPATAADRRLPDPAAVERLLAWLGEVVDGEGFGAGDRELPEFSE